MNISTITPCMGRKQHMEISIPTLYGQPDEQIVTDYSCPQKTGDWIEANYPKVKVVRIPDQKWFNKSKALNRAIEVATSEWICVLDADVVVAPNFISALKIHIKEASDYLKEELYVSQRRGSLSGFVACTKEAWSKIKFNEAMQGWGVEDDEFINGLNKHGYKRVEFVGYMGAIEHDDTLRTQNCLIQDRSISHRKNEELRRWK